MFRSEHGSELTETIGGYYRYEQGESCGEQSEGGREDEQASEQEWSETSEWGQGELIIVWGDDAQHGKQKVKPVSKMACKRLSSEVFVPGIVVFTGIGTPSGPNIPLASNAACQC